jgi:hypothetical protein
MLTRETATESATISGRKTNALTVATAKALAKLDLENSRGGTRTRDPGIMSAVL